MDVKDEAHFKGAVLGLGSLPEAQIEHIAPVFSPHSAPSFPPPGLSSFTPGVLCFRLTHVIPVAW